MSDNDFWRPGDGRTGTCWVCGLETDTIYADLGWQHFDCDRWPIDQHREIQIIRGKWKAVKRDR